MPATRINHGASGNAVVRPSPSNNQNPRPHIKVHHLWAGCIVWLPSRGYDDQSIKCIREFCCSNRELEEGGYNHPVVVLKVNQNNLGDTICSIIQVTSKERSKRLDRIKISQERPAWLPYNDNEGATELYLEDGTMDKQSYVVLEHIFQVTASQLRSCSFRSGSCAYDSRLCAQSYILLMGRLYLEPEGWVPTVALKRSIASSRETLSRQFIQQSRTFGNGDGFLTQRLAQQSLRAHQQSVSRDSHYNTHSGYRRFGESGRVPRPEGYGAYGRYRNFEESGHEFPLEDYDAYRYQRFEQGGREFPLEDYGEDGNVFFKVLVVLLAVGLFVWWCG